MISKTVLISFAIALISLCGCTVTDDTATVPPAAARLKAPTLSDLQQNAVDNTAAIRTLESLQNLAAEHVSNKTLLQLPGYLDNPPAPAPIEHNIELNLLEFAIAYNYLMTIRTDSDLQTYHQGRISQLIRYETAVLFAKISAGRLVPQLNDQDYYLELKVLTGISQTQLESIDFNCPLEPFAITQSTLLLQQAAMKNREESKIVLPQKFIDDFHVLFRNSPATSFLLSEQMLRLPKKLVIKDVANGDFYTNLTIATAISLEIEIDLQYLDQACQQYLTLKRQLANDPANAKISEMLVRQKLNWQIAYFRLLCDLNCDELPAANIAQPDLLTEDNQKKWFELLH